jgi:hypothetical protein
MLCLIELPRTAQMSYAGLVVTQTQILNLGENFSGQARRTDLDFGMAITAKQHAFAGFST